MQITFDTRLGFTPFQKKVNQQSTNFFKTIIDMRYGIVREIDSHRGEGTIEDLNQQEICFSLAGKEKSFSIGERVSFEIAMEQHGLRAVSISHSSDWAPVLLSHSHN